MLMTDCLTNIGGETTTLFSEEEEESAGRKKIIEITGVPG